MRAVFVTATGTDIGKTFVTAGLVRALSRQGMAVEALKPVLSGFDPSNVAESDAGLLLSALGRRVTIDEASAIAPWRFAAPLSPDMAAAREGTAIDFDALVDFCRARMAANSGALLIEGVGGVMVPLDHSRTVLDWMAALRVPALLVAGSYLGTISHTLTALDVLGCHGLRVLAVVVSETPGSTVALGETIATIQRFAHDTPVLALPRGLDDHRKARFFTDLSERLLP